MTAALQALIEAGHRAFAGPEANDAFVVHGLTAAEAAAYVRSLHEQVRADAEEQGVEMDEQELGLRVAFAALAAGLEYKP
jgi:hypothetical protein